MSPQFGSAALLLFLLASGSAVAQDSNLCARLNQRLASAPQTYEIDPTSARLDRELNDQLRALRSARSDLRRYGCSGERGDLYDDYASDRQCMMLEDEVLALQDRVADLQQSRRDDLRSRAGSNEGDLVRSRVLAALRANGCAIEGVPQREVSNPPKVYGNTPKALREQSPSVITVPTPSPKTEPTTTATAPAQPPMSEQPVAPEALPAPKAPTARVPSAALPPAPATPAKPQPTPPAVTATPAPEQPARPYDPSKANVRVVGPTFLPPNEKAIDLKNPK